MLVDISSLALLPRLRILCIRQALALTALAPLAKCVALEELHLTCGGSDLAPLAGCIRLHTLRLCGCPSLVDVTPLQECAALRRLTLRGCLALSDIWPLTGCVRLETLHVLHCPRLCDSGDGSSTSKEFLAALYILQHRVRSVRVLSGGQWARRLVHHTKQPPRTDQYSTPWMMKWQLPRWWGECQPHTLEHPVSHWAVFQAPPGAPPRRSAASAPPGVRFIEQPWTGWPCFTTICIRPTDMPGANEFTSFMQMQQGFLGALWALGYRDVEPVGRGLYLHVGHGVVPFQAYRIYTENGDVSASVLEQLARSVDGMQLEGWQTELAVVTAKGNWRRRKRHVPHQTSLIAPILVYL